MKHIIFFLLILFISLGLQAQQPPTPQQNNAGERLSAKIADKMKDTLNLTQQQRAKVFQVNMRLNNEKMEARRQYTDRTQLQTATQAIEKTRDSLYSPVLTAAQFELYKQKKRFLVTGN